MDRLIAIKGVMNKLALDDIYPKVIASEKIQVSYSYTSLNYWCHYGPYIIEHIEKYIVKHKHEELAETETWREMFINCSDKDPSPIESLTRYKLYIILDIFNDELIDKISFHNMIIRRKSSKSSCNRIDIDNIEIVFKNKEDKLFIQGLLNNPKSGYF